MSVFAEAFYFKDEQALKSFADGISNGTIKYDDRATSHQVAGSLSQSFGYGMREMLTNANYNIPDPDNLEVALSEKDLDKLIPIDEYCKDDIRTLRAGFKEFQAKLVYLC